ncbi:MAG: arylsulfatase A-like enzyme [Rhodothermales bacterium]|jgi:arylsulfatase A-like enzyme
MKSKHVYLLFVIPYLLLVTIASGAQPNILFLFTDDHAYQSIGAYGGILKPHVETPNIDQLAKEGMLFERCYTTNSICGPMRAAIQTGKYSHQNGFLVNGNKFDGTQQTFPKLLRKAGYTTAVVGKWHLGTHMAPQGYDYSEVLVGQGPYYNPPMRRDADGDGKSDGVVKHVGYTTDIITDLTLHWLSKKRDASKPFMLMYQHKAPHRNWQPGPKHLTLYDDVTLPEPDTLFDNYEGRGLAAHQQDMTIAETMTDSDLKITAPRNLTPEQLATWKAAYDPKNKALKEAKLSGKDLVRWKYQRYVKDYLRCVASVDENIGRVLNYLDESGLKENTLVIYCSDQGFFLGEHGWFDKRWIYEESLRTPFIARWPGTIKPGQRNRDIVSPIDFAPTFLEMAGVPNPGDLQGKSLLPIFAGNTPGDWRKTHYYHYYEYPGWHFVRRHYGVVDGRYKLVNFYEKDVMEWELYDLKSDPKEMRNVYGNPEYASISKRLHAELSTLRSDLGVPEQDPAASNRGFNMKPRRKPTKPAE